MVDLHFFMNCRKYRYCLIHAPTESNLIYLFITQTPGKDI